MDLKTKKNLTFILSLILTVGIVVLLAYAYMNNFTMGYTFSLLGAVIVTMVAWVFYYITLTKYQESLTTKTKKYYTKGNRKESRKGKKSSK